LAKVRGFHLSRCLAAVIHQADKPPMQPSPSQGGAPRAISRESKASSSSSLRLGRLSHLGLSPEYFHRCRSNRGCVI
jgi:hypothetical protein